MEVLNLLENQLSKRLINNYSLIVDYDKQTLNYDAINSNHKIGFIIDYEFTNNNLDCQIEIYIKCNFTQNYIISPYKKKYIGLTTNNIKNFVNNLIIELNSKIDYFNENIYNNKTINFDHYVNFSVKKMNDGNYVSSVNSIYL